MAERQNTLMCSFDPKSPRVSAFEIHEWIHDQLRIPEHGVPVLQIDGPGRQVFIKMKQCNELYKIIQETNGQKEYKHSKVKYHKSKQRWQGWEPNVFESPISPRRCRKDQSESPLLNMETLNPFKRKHGPKHIDMQYLTALK